ncbi:hypothetical protein [Geotalea uraniireducens]|uniref:Lipoprotein n=1 Tax=Geotalea uraniireducens (strain Rf4) TaxID=351605 RepID=A5GD59_GEOUR|nr:hypothetical protein [Geotalea uraniireducens]ABQ24480.1 hypothetical protein Gura_0264 [Geotalea uraniireducens Rf4]
MKRMLLAAVMAIIVLTVTGCGDDSSVPPRIVTQILSDPVFDGDIAQDVNGAFTITQGMSSTVQSVFAGINPATGTEFRAFLDFPLRGVDGVPVNASIVSATLDIVIDSIQPLSGTVPIRIELVFFQPPTLQASDFDRAILLPLTFVTITPPISQADVGNHVAVDVTPLMTEAQIRGLDNFQIRILEDLGPVSPGLIEIDDSTGVNRDVLAPLLEVTYF